MDYKTAIEIDKHNLDEEAIEAAQLFDEFARREAPAKSRFDALKDALKVVQADVALEIRGWKLEQINSYFKLNLLKVSEEVYKQLVFIHPKVIQLYEDLAVARNEAAAFTAGRESMDKKIFMLNNLKDLHGQGYYAKIEGREFRKINIDLKVKQMKSVIAERIKREGVTFIGEAPGAIEKSETPDIRIETARSKLSEQIQDMKKTVGNKTPKVPKPAASPSRVKSA